MILTTVWCEFDGKIVVRFKNIANLINACGARFKLSWILSCEVFTLLMSEF